MTAFTRVSNYGDDTVTEIIESNLVSFLDWGFINIGAYNNVSSGTFDAFGIDYSTLKHLKVEGSTNGTVWQSQRKNWVWETGLEVGTPNAISGVTVNGSFYESGVTGDFAHYYDYNNGNVVFANAISLNSTVSLNYSYKLIEVEPTYEDELFNRIQHYTEGAPINFNSDVKDDYANYGPTRATLPYVGVEMVGREFKKGVELGNYIAYNDMTIIFHVMTESKSDSRKITDIIKNQFRRRIYLYDSNLVSEADAWPLDYRGMLKSGAKTYPALTATSGDGGYRINSYLGSSMDLKDIGSNQPMQQLGPSLYYKPIRMAAEVIF